MEMKKKMTVFSFSSDSSSLVKMRLSEMMTPAVPGGVWGSCQCWALLNPSLEILIILHSMDVMFLSIEESPAVILG